MPNWVFNGLTIEGKPESVKSLMTQMNKPFVKLHDNWNTETGQMEVKQTTYPNPVFAFHNIYNHLDHGVTNEEYLKQPPAGKNMTDWFKFETNDWYNFNVREWGPKWDVSYEEETGWGGECEIRRGEIISDVEWESQCHECDSKDCLEYNEESGNEVCTKCGFGRGE